MKLTVVLLLAATFCVTQNVLAQTVDWREGILSLPEHPNATSTEDIARFQQYVLAAGPYFATFKPGDWEANRELVRRMTAYSMALGILSRSNPQLRSAYAGVDRAMGSIRFPSGYFPVQTQQVAPQATPQAVNRSVPFSLTAPDLGTVPAADRATARAAESRYEQAASQASAAWENIDSVRQNLESRGMALNTQTAASLARLPLLFQFASEAMARHDWEEANTNLERAEGETRKILQTVGR